MAHVLASLGRPALVLSHNKTLAAQLYGELKGFFPKNAVEFFISYYDYYQPEAYVPQTDTYIAKDSSINDDIDRLRLRATSSLMEREDVVIVASVSAIYGLGDPEVYRQRLVTATVGQELARDALLEELVGVQYQRNDVAFERGTFRVRGDTVEVFPAYDEQAVRVEFWGDTVERIAKIDPLTGDTITQLGRAAVYPATHFVTERPTIERAVTAIRTELKARLAELRAQNKLLEAQRLESRTNFDIDMLREVGRCTGIENYSRHLTGRQPRERAAREEERARAGHHPLQAHGGGPDRLPAAARRPGALSPFRDRRDRAGRDHPGAAAGGVRRARGDQPAARGARPAGGVAGCDPRRGPGGIPPLRPLAHPDRGPGGPKPPRQGDPLRRPRDGLDAAGARRDDPAPQAPGGIQSGPRRHAAPHRKAGGRHPLRHSRARPPHDPSRGEGRAAAGRRQGARRADQAARGSDAGGRRGARLRAGGAAARPDPRAPGRRRHGVPCACPRTRSTGSVRSWAADSPRRL